jgi:predicted ArsR family transcriptional regulator
MRSAEAAAAYRALSDEGRVRLFTLISERDRPLDVAEMAAALELHPNTIRSHLRRLEAVGLVLSETEIRSSRGRPRLLFTTGPAAAGIAQGARDYRLLASMLAGYASTDTSDPSSVAETTGRTWGGYLAGPDRLHPSEIPDAAASVAMIARMMERLGFAPEVKDTGGVVELHLHNCPFREVAERYPNVVCALHLGILRGALEESAATLHATELQPFVTPSLCVARLAKG